MPIYTSIPGDSSIGMNLAALTFLDSKLQIDALRDVNETASIVYKAKRNDGKSGVLILGGGSPKNFILQTEPQIQEVLGLAEAGHDYFLQITDARPDTGGLSGATATEAMTWGKVDPEKLPDSVTCYTDSTIALPLLTAYALARRSPGRSAGSTTPARPATTSCRRLYLARLDEAEAEAATAGHPMTRVVAVDPDRPDPLILDEAAAILRSGGLVAFGTETVYGLGADATNPAAVARIFAAKGRPATNPLIVHVADGDGAIACVRTWPARRRAAGRPVLARPADPGPAPIDDHPRPRYRRARHGRRPGPRVRPSRAS